MSYPGPSAQAIATIHNLEAELAASRARVVEQVVEIRKLKAELQTLALRCAQAEIDAETTRLMVAEAGK